jgi:hypothetical protein
VRFEKVSGIWPKKKPDRCPPGFFHNNMLTVQPCTGPFNVQAIQCSSPRSSIRLVCSKKKKPSSWGASTRRRGKDRGRGFKFSDAARTGAVGLSSAALPLTSCDGRLVPKTRSPVRSPTGAPANYPGNRSCRRYCCREARYFLEVRLRTGGCYGSALKRPLPENRR